MAALKLELGGAATTPVMLRQSAPLSKARKYKVKTKFKRLVEIA